MQTSTVVLIIVLIILSIVMGFAIYEAVHMEQNYSAIKDWDFLRSSWASTTAPSPKTQAKPVAVFSCPKGSTISLGKAYVYPGSTCSASNSPQTAAINDISEDLQKLLDKKSTYSFDLSSNPLAKLSSGQTCLDKSGKKNLMFHALYACTTGKPANSS